MPARVVSPGMSEFERADRLHREPTVEDVRQLMGASTPHFALQLRNRIKTLIDGLPEGHPARVEGEREIERLDQLALGSERRGTIQAREQGLPSFRGRLDAAD
jgi:hypothetical protein